MEVESNPPLRGKNGFILSSVLIFHRTGKVDLIDQEWIV